MSVLNLTPIDSLWLLTTACLVFLMQAGFLCLEAGLSRAKHSMNVAVKNVGDYVVASIVFYFIGYGLMFGRSWHGLFGWSDYFIHPDNPGQTSFFFFQLVFCGTAATIVSGAMAERMKFSSYLFYSVFISALLYPLFGHWVWGGSYYTGQQGWLAQLGYLDFAGSSVVHQMGGWVSLAGIMVLGPRLGKFDAAGKPRRILGHNIPLALLGTFILWVGWFGFNGGSTLHMNDTVGGVIVNTNLGGAMGGIVALLAGWWYRKRPDILDLSNGILGGLVAITAGAAFVTPLAASVIGSVAGIVVLASGEWVERGLKMDDVVGAVPVHGFCGLWGVLATGLFAQPQFLLHPEARLYHVGIQALGSVVCFIVSFGGGYLFFTCLNRLKKIRVHPEGEMKGLNFSEHQAVSNLFELTSFMKEVSEKKDWNRRTTIDPYDDAGELGMRFNRLLGVIEKTIGDLQRSEKSLKSSEEQLRQSQKMEAVGRLTGGVAHDFNNLLAVITGYSELSLKDLKVGDPVRSNLKEIKDASDRAISLTKQLLAFSRKQVLQPKVLELDTVLNEMDHLLRRTLGEDIQLVIIPQPGLARIKADPNQLEQVILNLAVNARDAMPHGGKLTLETKNVILDGQYVHHHAHEVECGRHVLLTVTDTGHGMSPETLKHVFEPFFTTKERGRGTGLGLSMVYGIVKQSGGHISVYSEPGHGTTFKIYLPRVDEKIIARSKSEVLTPQKGSETVLVVEDEEKLRQLICKVLKGYGYTVLEASTGDEAQQVHEQYNGSIDLLVTDVIMPGVNGRQVADRLISDAPRTKVLFMSGYPDKTIVRHGVLEEGAHYLQKPFSPDLLARKVREVLSISCA